MTPIHFAAWLQNAHQRASWREISNTLGGRIPPGTLCRIAKTNGEWVPQKWRRYLGITARPTSATHQAPKRLSDLPAKTLKAMLENRETFA